MYEMKLKNEMVRDDYLFISLVLPKNRLTVSTHVTSYSVSDQQCNFERKYT
jgi:hypothetical protein